MPVVRGSPNPKHFRLPARLRKARKAARLTRKAVVQRAGGDQATVRDIETGQRLPTVATVARLAAALGCSAAHLAYGIGDPLTDGTPAMTDGMGDRLQAVRVERGLTKAALARLANLSPSTVGDIESGAQTGVDVLEALAVALGISPAWLAYGIGPQILPSRRRSAAAAPPS